MKVMTILGTRPEIIRLSLVIAKLDKICNHILVHTGQNYTESLNEIFFRDLGIRKPNYSLGIQSPSFGEQIGKIISETEKILILEKPDRLLILGDTNSGLSAIAAKRLGIPVYHMEAGNRCYDDRVPEEINRRIIDHTSDILMPYTVRSKENLVREGIKRERIFITGNPINEVLESYSRQIEKSNILGKLELQYGKFFLVTLHRAENVDVIDRLKNYFTALTMISKEYGFPIICSLHPRTKDKILKYGIHYDSSRIIMCEPFGFFDFVSLEKNAFCILSDSGTVQEECCIYGIPNITLRDVTERPETLEAGSNVIAGDSPQSITQMVKYVTTNKCQWTPPVEYTEANVSDKVVRIMLSKFEQFNIL